VPSRDALAGAVAVGVGLGVGEATAGMLLRVPSPVDAIGQQLIPAFPPALTAWAIETLGRANRAVLVAGILVVAIGVGALLGMAGRRHPLLAVAGFLAAAAAGALAATASPDASASGAWLTNLVAAAAGFLTLRWLLRLAPARPAASPPTSQTPTSPAHSRRSFLVAAAGAGVGAVGLLAVGRVALAGRGVLVDPAAFPLPEPRRALPALTPAQRWTTPEGLSPVLTPTARFFRIDTALRVPQVDPATWELRVHGLVDRETVLTYDDLLGLPLEEVDLTLQCVSNEVGGDLVGTARWTGVRLATVLELAGVAEGAEQVLGRSVDGFDAGFPLEAVTDGRPALVAVGMNGEPLPARHGFPARLVVPGLYGYVSATKWLAELELAPWEGVDGYWVPRGWSKRGPVKPSSRIDVPGTGARLPAGPTIVAGVAWAPGPGVAAVELQVDDGPWVPAERSSPLSAHTWVQWRATVDLPAGEHGIRVRTVDGTGAVQPQGPRPPAPDGAEGWHRVVVRTS
jgi:DMSO/TMAO reductase YedYZ molybdopterin-dependent catalytic subunit